jgi:hypothetical protein
MNEKNTRGKIKGKKTPPAVHGGDWVRSQFFDSSNVMNYHPR